MLDTAHRGNFDRLAARFSAAADRVLHTHFSQFAPTDAWSPAVNAYRLADAIEVCVDLAGVEKKTIDVQVEPGELTIRGVRNAPQPESPEGEAIYILAMEIDHGPFQRSITLPPEIDTDQVSAEQHNGLLWIRLPLRPDAT